MSANSIPEENIQHLRFSEANVGWWLAASGYFRYVYIKSSLEEASPKEKDASKTRLSLARGGSFIESGAKFKNNLE
jgi:hypothetical protein